MKNKKTNIYKLLAGAAITSTFFLGLIYVCEQSIIKMTVFWTNFLVMHTDSFEIKIKQVKAEEKKKVYAYNEQVPEDVILDEMHSLSKRFNIDDIKWERLLRCESTCVANYCEKGKLDNLAINPKSTATGLGQYLIGTWQVTESWKQYRCSRTDYKCALWEMALDLSQGESWRWKECLDITGIKFNN